MLKSQMHETVPPLELMGVPSTRMPHPARKTLLEPGHEAEWQRLNEEKRSGMAPPADTPVGELLRRGQRLSAQAAKLLRAVERADGGNRS